MIIPLLYSSRILFAFRCFLLFLVSINSIFQPISLLSTPDYQYATKQIAVRLPLPHSLRNGQIPDDLLLEFFLLPLSFFTHSIPFFFHPAGCARRRWRKCRAPNDIYWKNKWIDATTEKNTLFNLWRRSQHSRIPERKHAGEHFNWALNWKILKSRRFQLVDIDMQVLNYCVLVIIQLDCNSKKKHVPEVKKQCSLSLEKISTVTWIQTRHESMVWICTSASNFLFSQSQLWLFFRSPTFASLTWAITQTSSTSQKTGHSHQVLLIMYHVHDMCVVIGREEEDTQHFLEENVSLLVSSEKEKEEESLERCANKTQFLRYIQSVWAIWRKGTTRGAQGNKKKQLGGLELGLCKVVQHSWYENNGFGTVDLDIPV